MSTILLLLALMLTPQECKDQCKACVCKYDGGWICVCVPKDGQGD